MADVIRRDKSGKTSSAEDFSWDSLAKAVGQARSSRYNNHDFYIDEERKAIYRETYSRSVIPKRGVKYFRVTAGYEYRPDLVSVDAYGTPKYWYKILEMNGLTGFEQFVRGMTILIPSKEEVVPGA